MIADHHMITYDGSDAEKHTLPDLASAGDVDTGRDGAVPPDPCMMPDTRLSIDRHKIIDARKSRSNCILQDHDALSDCDRGCDPTRRINQRMETIDNILRRRMEVLDNRSLALRLTDADVPLPTAFIRRDDL